MAQRLWRVASLSLLTLVLFGSPALADGWVYVRTRPPAPIVETRPAPRHHGYVWRPGYHRWDGHRYVWVGGRWVRPPYARARWASGRWQHHERHGWHWVPGHWARG
jgi:hypothetical protein